MTYSLDIDPRVTREVGKIFAYWEKQKKGSGERFMKALDACYDQLIEFPMGYQKRKGEFRHALLHKLKYRVVYKVHETTIYVVQVRHTSRKPSKKFGP